MLQIMMIVTMKVFINPGRPEICNNFSDNCNAETDEGLTFTIYYADEDADGYGSPDVFISSCQPSPPAGYSNDFTDCNDFYFSQTLAQWKHVMVLTTIVIPISMKV